MRIINHKEIDPWLQNYLQDSISSSQYSSESAWKSPRPMFVENCAIGPGSRQEDVFGRGKSLSDRRPNPNKILAQKKFSSPKNLGYQRRMAWEEDKAWVAGSAPRERSLTPHNSLRVKSELFFINFDFNKYIFWHNSTINSTQILNFQISKINLAGQIVR